MSKRKTRQEKILAEKRNKERKEQIIELEKLRFNAFALQSKITKQSKESLKQFHIRNLKFFINTCNFVMPFVISTGITAGVFKSFGGGLPFYLDEITKYKEYHLDYQTEGNITMNDEYVERSSLPSNSLIVITPWEEQNGQYVRFKREYIIEKLTTLDLYNVVLDEDYNYILENLKEYKEEKQVTNQINPEDNDYFFEASLHMQDKEDILKYKETDLKNIIITIVELILGLGGGGIIAHRRKFEFLCELRNANNNYRYHISLVKSLKEELEKTNERILSLSRTKEGKI